MSVNTGVVGTSGTSGSGSYTGYGYDQVTQCCGSEPKTNFGGPYYSKTEGFSAREKYGSDITFSCKTCKEIIIRENLISKDEWKNIKRTELIDKML